MKISHLGLQLVYVSVTILREKEKKDDVYRNDHIKTPSPYLSKYR